MQGMYNITTKFFGAKTRTACPENKYMETQCTRSALLVAIFVDNMNIFEQAIRRRRKRKDKL